MPYIDSFNVGNVVYDIRDKYAGLYTASAYSNSATYAVGDMVTRDGKLYECNTPILTAEEWTPAHWTETTIGVQVSGLEKLINDISTIFPSNAYPIIKNGIAINAHPVPALNLTKIGSFFKITGTRGSTGPVINLLDTTFDLLTQNNYLPDRSVEMPNYDNLEIACIVKGTITNATLTGIAIQIAISEIVENPQSGDASTTIDRRCTINHQATPYNNIYWFKLNDVKNKKVRPTIYLRSNGEYDIELNFVLIPPNTSLQAALQALILENT